MYQKVQRRTLVVLMVSQIIGTIGVGIAPSIGVLLAGEVTHNEAWAGLARTAATLGTAVIGLPLGMLAARAGRRAALSLGWLIAAVGASVLVVAAQLYSVVPLFVGLLLIGAGTAVALQARFAATDLADPGRQARDLSVVVWCQTIGSSLGPNLGVPGAAVGGWLGINLYAGAFLIAAVCLCAAAATVFALLRPDPLILAGGGHRADVSRNKHRRGVLWALIRRDVTIRRAVVALLTGQVVMVTLMTMAPVHLHHHGVSVTVVGLSISVHIVCMYVFAPVIGVLVDRTGYRLSATVGMGILMAAAVCAIVWPEDMVWMVVSLGLLGVGWCFLNVAGSALFSRTVGEEYKASAQGAVDALTSLCAAMTAFLAGPILVATSYPTLAWITVVLMVPLAVCIPGMRRESVQA